jgi:hypothetical protein
MQAMIRSTKGLGLLLRINADLLLAVGVILLSLVVGSWLAEQLLF